MTDEETYPTVPGDQGQPVPVPWLTGDAPNPRVAPVNRWAAFTNDELEKLADGLMEAHERYFGPPSDRDTSLHDELYAELERRKT